MSFLRYNPEDSVISSETVVRGLWAGDANILTAANMFTASDYTTSDDKEYYLNTYNTCSICPGSSVQYSIQYGNLYGSGSKLINPSVTTTVSGALTPSRVIYGEYRNLVFGTETQNFSFDNGATTASAVFVINIARSRYKESLLPGSFNLNLRSGSNSLNLTDDSATTSLTRFIGENRVYYIISGSNGSAYTPAASSSYYGMMFPDLDIIVLNATSSTTLSAGNQITNFFAPLGTTTASKSNNHLKLYNSIVAGNAFQLQSQETISSRYFFTRVKNGDFNYTTNPSIIDANGNLLYTTLINNPQTYVTTVGMYNDNNELLAVAKLSKPLTKDFTKEALIRIKLDY
jgi:hypothetical protein